MIPSFKRRNANELRKVVSSEDWSDVKIPTNLQLRKVNSMNSLYFKQAFDIAKKNKKDSNEEYSMDLETPGLQTDPDILQEHEIDSEIVQLRKEFETYSVPISESKYKTKSLGIEKLWSPVST